jgi:hypothetical protein
MTFILKSSGSTLGRHEQIIDLYPIARDYQDKNNCLTRRSVSAGLETE